MTQTLHRSRPPVGVALWRALNRRCPACGEGQLFASYLRQVDQCAHCGEAFGHIRADDAPPWLTILVVGHILVPLAVLVESFAVWPEWVSMAVWPLLAIALSLVILPRAKAVFLTLVWITRAPGSETS